MTKKRQIYTEAEIQAYVAEATQGKYYVAPNIYLEITKKGKANWKTRFRFNGKAFEKIVGTYGEGNPYYMSYEGAINSSIKFQRSLTAKENPLERSHAMIETVNDLMTTFIEHKTCKYEKEQKVYEEIKPTLGKKRIDKVTCADLEKVIKEMVDSDRKSIAAIAVGLFKNLFDYASTHNLVTQNVAAHLKKTHHAGQTDEVRKIHLTLPQIRKVFSVFQRYPAQATLTNQCAIALYVIFGFRKSELLTAKWKDFNRVERELTIRPTKKGQEELTVKIPKSVMPIFDYLQQQAGDSSFIFPSKGGSMSGHVSESTLNAMIRTFYKTHKTQSVQFDNPLRAESVPEFCVHDLRRTFSTIAADHAVKSNVIELGLNHKKRKSIRPYDHSTRPRQRKKMYKLLAKKILPLTNLLTLIDKQLQEADAVSLPKAA